MSVRRVVFGLVACSTFWGCSGASNSEDSEMAEAQVSTSAPVSTVVTTSMATSTTVETTTTTLAPVYTCDPMPESDLVLNIETDLSEEVIAPFLCGIHAAAVELEIGTLELNVVMFEDMVAMEEVIGRLVPEYPFERVANGYYALLGEKTIYWNYPNTVRERDEFAFVFRVGTHELFHAAQGVYAKGKLRFGQSLVWLLEGSAEYFALGMLEKYGFDEHLERWTLFGEIFSFNYAVDPGTLKTWNTYGPYGEGKAPFLNYPLVAEIAGRLADMTSDEAVLETFWRETAPDEEWEVTFERVFGMSVDDFYALIDSEYLARKPT